VNTTQNKTLIFITPSLDRKGSEVALINYIKHIDKSFHSKLISKYKGDLFESVLPDIEKNYFLKIKPTHSYFNRIKARIKIQLNYSSVLTSAARLKEPIFYINTIILPKVLSYAEKNKIKTIVHTHELEQMYAQLSLQQIKRLVTYPYLIIANSKASANVIQTFGRKGNIEICYPALDTASIKPDKDRKILFGNKLGIPENHFVWVMSGTLDKNKNPFLFVEIASIIIKSKPDTTFLWIGGTINSHFEKACKELADEHHVSNNIIWAGDVAEKYHEYFNCADGFVLTSEKESFSMVTVEALLYGLPVVTQNCGGVIEILKNDIGKIVREKNDASRMAAEMICFMDGIYKVDKEKQILRASEFDTSIISKRWNDILAKYC
jgi:glycosyltransferase involved in cell wall biosynthesis